MNGYSHAHMNAHTRTHTYTHTYAHTRTHTHRTRTRARARTQRARARRARVHTPSCGGRALGPLPTPLQRSFRRNRLLQTLEPRSECSGSSAPSCLPIRNERAHVAYSLPPNTSHQAHHSPPTWLMGWGQGSLSGEV